MSAIESSASALTYTLHVLDEVTNNVKKLTKVARASFKKDFEAAFEVCGGPYTHPQPPSPLQSDDEASSLGEAGDAAECFSPAAAAAAGLSGVTMRSAFGAILIHLTSAVEEQMELARRVLPQANVPAVVEVVMKSCEPLPKALHTCFEYVYGPDTVAAAELNAPAGATLERCLQCAVEVERRTRALLAWAKLKKMGDDAPVVAPASPPPPPDGTRGKVAPVTATPPSSCGSGDFSPSTVAPQVKPSKQSVSSQRTPSIATTSASKPATIRSYRLGVMTESDDDDDGSSAAVDATNLLSQLTFNVPGEEQPTRNGAVSHADGAAFGPAEELGRRNVRGRKLLAGVVEQTAEPMTEARRKTIVQSATVRDMMGTLAPREYNIVAFQVRTAPQQIGENGPVLWCGALDACVSDDVANEEDVPRRRWMEERIGPQPLEAGEKEGCRWIELVRSEACVRGAQAKLRVVTMGAQLLFPREFQLYCTLQRDDISQPDVVMEKIYADGLKGKCEIPLGRLITFVADRSSSFLAQAFQLMQDRRPEVGTLRLDIAGEHSPTQDYGAESVPKNYTVRILRANGTVLTAQSSEEYAEQRMAAVWPALVPTVFDAVYNAAERLGALEQYNQLKASFDRLCLPVSNEPREYITSYFTIVFGMSVSPPNMLKDPVRIAEKPVTGGWSTVLSIAFPRTPTNRRGEYKFVDVETRHSSTKRVARNDTLTYAGKTNFTPELLRMMDYGTAPQKGQAEAILVTPVAGIIPVHHALRDEIAKLKRASAAAQAWGNAPGEVVMTEKLRRRFGHLSPCDQLIADAIERNLPAAVREMAEWLEQNFGGFGCNLHLYPEAVDAALAAPPAQEVEFGSLTYHWQYADACAEGEGNGGERPIPIKGRSPIFAVFAATRCLREAFECAKSKTQTIPKAARLHTEAAPAEKTQTAATTSVPANTTAFALTKPPASPAAPATPFNTMTTVPTW